MTIAALRARLEASRSALVATLQGLSERDFTTDVGDGITLLQLLAGLAPAEREAVRRAREAAGAATRPTPDRVERERLLPPALIHDLAGARLLQLDPFGIEQVPGVYPYPVYSEPKVRHRPSLESVSGRAVFYWRPRSSVKRPCFTLSPKGLRRWSKRAAA